MVARMSTKVLEGFVLMGNITLFSWFENQIYLGITAVYGTTGTEAEVTVQSSCSSIRAKARADRARVLLQVP